jgi:hypothetical protein
MALQLNLVQFNLFLKLFKHDRVSYGLKMLGLGLKQLNFFHQMVVFAEVVKETMDF